VKPTRSKKAGGRSPAARPKTRSPRRRLTAEAAREVILEAAEARLRAEGPEGLRLQDIARDVGLSHPTVLHHFGSKQGLVEALVARSMTALEDELVACFREAKRPDDLVPTMARVDEVMRVRGQARLLAWLALTQADDQRAPESRLREVAELAHAARAALASGEVSYEDTAFGIMLASTAAFGAALIGPGLLEALGLPSDGATVARFSRWVAELLAARAGLPGAGPPSRG